MKKLLVAALIAVGAAPASAAVVTFDNLAFQGNSNTLSTDGFTFSNPNYAQYFYFSGFSGMNNGTDFYMYSYGNSTIARTDGSAFVLNSFDVARSEYTTGTFEYLLTLAGGGTESGSFAVTNAFQTLTIGKSITSLLLYDFQDYVAIDNITYGEAVADVAEPAMLGLFGLGTLSLGLARRRRRRTV